MFLTYAQVLAHLESLGLFHMDLTLERMHNALGRLDLHKPPYTIIQVVGTNGKGSTSTFLASLAKAHNVRAGLYTSPHFVSPRERILCHGHMLPEERWAKLGSAVYAAEPKLTYFEFLTVLAALAFAEAGVDVAVLEAGLGGRWDATTALPAQILCMTPISMDHERVLGSTLEAIAADKADAIRFGMTVLHAAQSPKVLDVIRRKAQSVTATLHAADECVALPPPCTLGLSGPHQQGNALLALTAWRTLCTQRSLPCDAAAEARGLAQAFLPGRLQSLRLGDDPLQPPTFLPFSPCSPCSPPTPRTGLPMLLDGAHNHHGLQALHDALARERIQPSAVIFSCLADKDMTHMLPYIKEIAGKAPLWIPTIANNPRAADSVMLASLLAEKCTAKVTAVPSLQEALNTVQDPAHRLNDGPILLCGSLYLLGEFFEHYPHFLQSPHAYSEDI